MKKTFWSLLQDHAIVIPLFQRDYAQGRADPRSSQIRETFVRALHEALDRDDGMLELDFIYGSVSGEGNLTVMDGQQRLTTLFLLHWYLAGACGMLVPEVTARLRRFSYETRLSSRYFCQALAMHAFSPESPSESPAAWIKAAPWFEYSWQFDQTVRSMLVMIDCIHERFRESPHRRIWDRLIEAGQPAVSFQFARLDEFGLSHDLYLKMNSRGLPLTDFEQFKAWLECTAERNGWTVPECNWTSRMDREWTDFFWRHRGAACEIDSPFLAFFRGIAMYNLALKTTIDSGKLDSAAADRFRRFNENEFISTSDYAAWECFDGETLSHAFALLDHFVRQPSGEAAESLQAFVSPRNYSDRLLAYSYLLPVTSPLASLHAGQQKWQANRNDWLRVAGNLVRNTLIDDPLRFVEAVQSLKTLFDRVFCLPYAENGVLVQMAALEDDGIRFFSREQRVEEIRKCRLLLNNCRWKPLLEKFERHPYFQGQIWFLIELALTEPTDEDRQKVFATYAERAAALFSDPILRHPDALLERALLTIGNYLIDKGWNQSLCRPDHQTLRQREENWRRVFRDERRVGLLRQLLLQLETGKEEAGLRALIETATVLDHVNDEWRQFIRECPEAIQVCQERQIRFGEMEGTVLLLSKTRLSGYYAELHSFHLYHGFLLPGIESGFLLPFSRVDYHWDLGGQGEPKAVLNGLKVQDRDWRLEISFRNLH